MIRLGALTKGIATRMLARDGIAAIWRLHIAAGIAYRTGNRSAAASITEIAEAAERECQWSEQLAVFVRRSSPE